MLLASVVETIRIGDVVAARDLLRVKVRFLFSPLIGCEVAVLRVAKSLLRAEYIVHDQSLVFIVDNILLLLSQVQVLLAEHGRCSLLAEAALLLFLPPLHAPYGLR